MGQPIEQSSGAAVAWVGVVAIAGLAGLFAAWVYAMNPEEVGQRGAGAGSASSGSPVFLRCHFRELTGLDCPGCGGTRAAHYLMHGDVAAAVRMNVMAVALVPIGGLAAVAAWWSASRERRRVADTRWPGLVAALAAAVFLGFGVVRNLPWWPWPLP